MSIDSNLARRPQEPLDTALHEAVSSRNLTATARLIEARANVNSLQALSGLTPLQMAINNNWPDGCSLLLHQGADLRVIDNRRDWAFLTRTALNQGLRCSQAEYEIAMENNDLETVSNLLARGIQPEDYTRISHWLRKNILDKTGSPATIQLLLRQLGYSKANITVITQPAISADWPELLPYLIELGSDVNAGLQYVMQTGKKHLLQTFIDAGADKEQGIIHAFYMGYRQMIPTLVAAGIDADRGILEAIKKNEREAVRFFLEKGAIPSAETWTLAMELCHKHYVDDLLAHDAVPDRNTLLMALKMDNRQVLRACIKHKVVPLVEMLHMAVEHSNLDLIHHLQATHRIRGEEILQIAVEKNAPKVILNFVNSGVVPNEEIWNIILDRGNIDLVRSFLGCTTLPNDEIRQKMVKLAIDKSKVGLFIDKGVIDLFRFLLHTSECAAFNEDLLQKIFTLAVSDEERFELAIIGNSLHRVEHFITAGANKDDTLKCAILHEKQDLISYLIQAGADKNRGLAIAISHGKVKAVHQLIDAGADKNLGLDEAVKESFIEIVQYLLGKGAIPSVETFKFALTNRRPGLALNLLTYGITPSDEILAIAVEHSAQNIVQHLLDGGMVPSMEVMQTAVAKSDLELVRLLIESGGVMDQATRHKLTERLIDVKCVNISLFLEAQRQKVGVLEVYGKNGFESVSNRSALPTKPLFILNIAKYDAPGPNYGAITQYYTPALQDVYGKIAKHFTLVRVLVDDPDKLVSTIDRAQAAFPGLPICHWALNGHGGSSAIGLGERNFTAVDAPIMKEIGKRMDRHGTLSLWGCSNGESEKNLASVFSENAPQIPVFATPGSVSRVIPNTFKLKPNVAVFAPFFRDNYGDPELMRAYRNGEEIANGYKPPSRL